jgi:hypothetical protein
VLQQNTIVQRDAITESQQNYRTANAPYGQAPKYRHRKSKEPAGTPAVRNQLRRAASDTFLTPPQPSPKLAVSFKSAKRTRGARVAETHLSTPRARPS